MNSKTDSGLVREYRNRIKQLEKALKPFADASGWQTSSPKSMVKNHHFDTARKILIKE